MESITGTVLALSGASGYDKNGKDFDILRDLLITTDSLAAEPYAGLGLVGALDTVPDLTVFAPEDNAFKGLAGTIASVTGNTAPMGEAATVGFLADALTLLGKGDPSGLLTDILTYHVTPGVFELADVVALGDGAAVPTLQGGTLTTEFDTTPPSLIDADMGVANPGIIATDVAASNGVIHVLDGVLLPLSVSAILTQKNTDFEIGGDGRDHFVTGRGMAGERFEDLPWYEPQGFHARPRKGDIGVLVAPGGRRDQGMVMAAPAHNGGLPELSEGEAAMHDGNGNVVTLTASGWSFNMDVTITGNLHVEGDITNSGNITSGGSVTDADGDGGA